MSVPSRKPLLDKLITDFATFKHPGTTDNCFAEVVKIVVNEWPTSLPTCEVIMTDASVQVTGNDWNIQYYNFSSIVYELIETNASTAVANTKIDRLASIEDAINAYLQKIPNNLEHAVTNVHVVNIDVNPSRYVYEESPQGLRLAQRIDFSLEININVKLL